MAPRRGGSGYSSYSSLSDSHWNDEVVFSKDALISPSNFTAGFAFDVLTVVALIAFIVWACTIRDHRGQLKGVLGTLFSWLAAVVLLMIPKIFYLADATVTYYYLIDLMLNQFFGLLTDSLLVFVFYNLIHGLLDRLTDSGKPYAPVKIVHWVTLGLLSILSVADWGLYVAQWVEMVNRQSNWIYLQENWTKLDGARSIILWLIALEVLAWAIFVAVKAGSHRFASKIPSIALIVGSIFWFALTLMYMVISIRYNLERRYRTPWYIGTAKSICQFFFCIGTMGGILLCCMKWSKLGSEGEKPPTIPSGGPGQPYPTYPTWQAYPQQYAPYPPQLQPGTQPYQYPQPQPLASAPVSAPVSAPAHAPAPTQPAP
ncbi:hypothetical protein N7512_001858 [Penicillium capsulatum]|nr:hypothetical protein N7512_001858 [Penicillium capsulatum]